jgi:ABC-2 type transport system ATP-binding protein
VGLDALTRSRVLDYLAARARQGLSIVFTTHILHEADRLCQRIGVMHEGHLLTVGAPSEIKRTYSSARTVEVEFQRALTTPEQEELGLLFTRRGEGLGPVERRGDLFVVRSRNPEELIAEVVRWAHANGAGLQRIALSESTLEDAFVQLVSRPVDTPLLPAGEGP